MSRSWSKGSTRAWRRLRRLCLERDGYRCQRQVPSLDDDGTTVLCGAPANHAGHKLARCLGGLDVLDNLQAECAEHNLSDGGALSHRAEGPGRWAW